MAQTPFAEVVRDVLIRGFAFFRHEPGPYHEVVGAMRSVTGLNLRVQYDEIIDSFSARPQFRLSLAKTYGLGEFPLHTDRAHDRIPPRFIIMSQIEASSVAKTRVLPIGMMRLSHEERSILLRDVWSVRYGRKPFLTPILNDTLVPSEEVLRWDPVCMMSGSSKSAQVINECVMRSKVIEVQHAPEHTLIIDNWKSLHGRTAIEQRGRRLLRRLLVGH